MASQPLRRVEPSRVSADLTHYWRDGYAIVRGFFGRARNSGNLGALDQLYAEGAAHGRCFRHGNLFYNVARETEGGEPLVRMVQWPSYHQPVLNSVRLDLRFAELLEPLIGYNLKQIINQVHWKAPGSLGDFAWHQDSRFRRPASAYRNLATSYVQTGLAIDPHTPESGCMSSSRAAICAAIWTWIRRSWCSVPRCRTTCWSRSACRLRMPSSCCSNRATLLSGAPYLVHGSGTNRSNHKRRLYINGYVRAT